MASSLAQASHFPILAVLDETDWAEDHSERHGGSRFGVSLAALRASNAHMVAAGHEIFHLNAKLAGSPHHPSLFRVRHGCDSVGAFGHHDRVSDLQVAVELKLDLVSDVGGF
jgi:hypothetical protein